MLLTQHIAIAARARGWAWPTEGWEEVKIFQYKTRADTRIGPIVVLTMQPGQRNTA